MVERLASRVGHQQADQEARIAALKAAAEVEGSYVRTCRDVENGEKQRQELDNSLNTGQGFVTAQQLQQQQHFQQLGAYFRILEKYEAKLFPFISQDNPGTSS